MVGGFTSFNGHSFNRMVLLNSSGGVDGSFSTGSGANDNVRSVDITDIQASSPIFHSSFGTTAAPDSYTVDTGGNSGTIFINYDFSEAFGISDNLRVYYNGARILDLTTNDINQITVNYGPARPRWLRWW